MSILGENIKSYREKSNYSKTKLSDLSGVALSTLSQIESGVRENLNAATVSKIAVALEITASDLMEVKEGEYNISELVDAMEIILSDDDIAIDSKIMTREEKEQFKFVVQMAINTIRNNRR